MLSYSLRRWPNIEIAFGDCPVFAGVLPHIAMPVTLYYPDARKATSQITRHIGQCWCNDEPLSATLGQHYLNQNPLSPNHKYNREYYFFLTPFLKSELSGLGTLNVIYWTCS